MSTRNIVLKLDITSGVLTKLVDTNPIKENQFGDIYWLYAPYGTNVAKIKFFPQKFFDLTGVNPVPALKMFQETDEEVISAIIPSGDMETGWSAFYYPVGLGISGIVKSNYATQYDVSFQELEVDNTDEAYIGEYATVATVDSTVENELNAEFNTPFGTANDDDYVNVYQTALTSSQYNSWLCINAIGGEWENQDELINEQITSNTLTYRETFKATTLSNDDFNAGTPTEQALVLNQIYSELAELQAGYEAISLGGMLASEYATEISATKDVWTSRNTRTSVGVDERTALEISTTVGRVDQDVKTTASPTFVTTIMSELRLNGDVAVGGQTWSNTELAVETVINADVTLQNGRELLKLGRNTSGVTIANGSVVAIIGSVGQVAEIELLDITDADQSFKVIGTATEDILNNAVGNITLIGRVRGLNTIAWAEGTILYADVAGGLSSTKPAKGNRTVLMAVVETSNAGAGVIWQFPRPLPFIGELSDVDTSTAVEEDLLIKNASNTFEPYALGNIKFVKTGWPIDIFDSVDVALSVLTFTLTINTDTYYYIDNVRYEIVAGDYTVDITDTSGAWFFYFTGDSSTLTASQTVWSIRAADKALVVGLYYNSTTNEATTLGYEFHSYEMSPADHYHGHFTAATTVVSGLAVSPSATLPSVLGTVGVTQGLLMDEDIVMQILNGTLGSAKFTQELTVLKAYKYWRIGASEIYRDDYDTNMALMVGGIPQVNPYDGSVYSLADATNNFYSAMWIVYTNDCEAPVQVWTGQQESSTLNNAIELNGLDSMNFGAIPIAEIRVSYRLMIRRQGSSYTLYQVDNFITDPTTGLPTNPATSHGSLSGLLDDDHTQYYNDVRLNATTGASKVGYDNTVNALESTNIQDVVDELEINKINTTDGLKTSKLTYIPEIYDSYIATDDGFYSPDGTFNPSAGIVGSSGFIEVDEGRVVTITIPILSLALSTIISFQDSVGTFLPSEGITGTPGSTTNVVINTFTMPLGASTFAVGISVAEKSDYSITYIDDKISNDLITDNTLEAVKLSDGAFSFTGNKVYSGGSLIYVERVFDFNPYSLTVGDKHTVNYDIYTDDDNLIESGNIIFLNDNPALGSYTGGITLSDQYLQDLPQEVITSYNQIRDDGYISTYRYAHVFIVLPPVVNQLSTFYIKELEYKIGDTVIAPITGYGLVAGGTGSYVEEEQDYNLKINLLNYKNYTAIVPSNLYNKKVAFLGDSITVGVFWDGSGFDITDKPYHYWLKKHLQLHTSYNYGVSSSAISDSSTSSAVPFTDRYSAMNDDAEFIVVFGGTNDFGFNTPIGTIADTTDISFYGALKVLMEGLINKYVGKRIAFITPYHRTTEDTPNTEGHVLSDYVDVIKEMATIYGLFVIDAYSNSGISTTITAFETAYVNDGIHLNEDGHELFAKNIVRTLSLL